MVIYHTILLVLIAASAYSSDVKVANPVRNPSCPLFLEIYEILCVFHPSSLNAFVIV